MYFEVHALAGTAVVVALPLVGTFWVSFLVGSHPQRSFFLYYPDLCPRSRGCPVLTHIDLSVSERHHTYDWCTGTLVAAAACAVCGVSSNFGLTLW